MYLLSSVELVKFYDETKKLLDIVDAEISEVNDKISNFDGDEQYESSGMILRGWYQRLASLDEDRQGLRFEEYEDLEFHQCEKEIGLLRELAKNNKVLIDESDFEEYTVVVCTDLGLVGGDSSVLVIDWEATANNLMADYGSVVLGYTKFFYRK